MFTSTSTALPISNTALAARLAIFIAKGFLASPNFPQAAHAAKEAFGYGEDSLLENLLHPAALLVTQHDIYEDHPGVFEYEVAEPLGEWLAEYLATPENEGSVGWDVLQERIEELVAEFFNIKNSLTTEEQTTLAKLRQAGFAVAIWTPAELGNVDPQRIECLAIERGNEALEDLRR